MAYLAVGAGAFIGANLRYLLANWSAARWGDSFPYGTMIINVSGAFAIGLLLSTLTTRAGLPAATRLFLITGLLGGYTTFSTYTWEALALATDGALLRCLAYVVASNVLGLIGVWLGAKLGAGISLA